MTASSPKVATNSPNHCAPPVLALFEAKNTGSPNIVFAAATIEKAPAVCAAMYAKASRQEIPRCHASQMVTAGLKCAPEIGPKVKISATSAAPVAIVLMRSETATLPLASRSPIIPEPTTVASSIVVPMASVAKAFRDKRLIAVSENKLTPTKKFESISVGEILDFWWERHGKTKRAFKYMMDRLERFRKIKARNLQPDTVQQFLDEILRDYSASMTNHYRTILNSSFNYAIKWKKYDDNPINVIPQVPEPEPRDRFVEVSELAALIEQCQLKGDAELQAFIILAACTGLRKNVVLSRVERGAVRR